MRRICFVIPDLSLGGAQKQCLALASAINRLTRHHIIIVTLRNSGQMGHLLKAYKLEATSLDISSGFDLRAVLRLRRILKAHEIDILVTWLHSTDVIGFLATRFRKIAWVLNERDSKYEKKFRYILRFASGFFATLIVANSAEGVVYWKRLFFWKSFYRINNIVEVESANSLSTKEIDLIYGGRFSNQKNVLLISDLLSQLVTVRPDIRIVLRGEGDLYSECRVLLKNGIANGNVDFGGYDSNFRELLKKSKALISLSHHEGSPNVVLESLSIGIVPILSRIPAHIAIVGRDYPFFIDPNMSTDQSVEVILEAISSDDSSVLSHSTSFLNRCSEVFVTNQFLEIIEKEGI